MKDSGLYKDCYAAGGMLAYAYGDDPKRLAFTLARYKHTAMMLRGLDSVLEVGCGDGFASRIVKQHVGALTAIDKDETFIKLAGERSTNSDWPIVFRCGDIVDGHWQNFDAVYALDVLEHIRPDDDFLFNMAMAAPVAIIGTPSLESQQYASKLSRRGHVNCYGGNGLRVRLKDFWENVFVFTMHDETLGTSFYGMSQYLLALCVGPKM